MGVGLKNVRIQIKRWGLKNYYNAQGYNQNFFRVRGFVHPGHFDKYFIKKPKEKRPHMEKLGVFSPRYSSNYTLNRKINSKKHKIRVFFDFQKRAGETSLLPPLVVGLVLEVPGGGGNDL